MLEKEPLIMTMCLMKTGESSQFIFFFLRYFWFYTFKLTASTTSFSSLPFSNQAEIYNSIVSRLVDGCFKGYNATVFAYGQTGTGKTHTMTGVEGDAELEGIMPRAFNQIFECIN